MRNLKLALFATALAGCCVVPLAYGQSGERHHGPGTLLDGLGVSNPISSGTTTVANQIPVTIANTPPPEDLVISARNEGLVLIRGVENCATVATALKNSMDVQQAECRKPYSSGRHGSQVFP